jgi:hypothetical protein
MTHRFRAARASTLALAAILAGSSIAAAAPPMATFTAPVRIGFLNGDDWEPSIAADRFGHVYALWTHYVGFEGSSSGDIDPTCPDCPSPHMVLQVSDDNGVTWGPPHALAPAETRQDDPQIVVDAADGRTVYAAYMEGNKSSLFVSRSDDFGVTFRPVLVEDIERGLDKIALAARGGHVYLSYHSQQKIFVSVSHDGGATWTVTQPVNNTNSEFGVSLPSGATVAPDGSAYFAFNGVNQPGQAKGTINLYVARTYDGGATWGTTVVAVSQAPAPCGCGAWDWWGAQIAIGSDDDGVVSVLWNQNSVKYGPHRMYFASSTDRGRSFGPAVDVSLAATGTNNVFPALVAAGHGDVRIAWQDDRNGFDAGGNDPNARWNTYYRASADGGATWSPETKLSAFVSGYTYKLATPKDGYLQPYGDYFEIDIDSSGKTVALWGEGNSYFGPGNVWFARQVE